MGENLTLLHVNNKGADQPAHPHSLISAFVIRFLQSMKFKLASNIISSLQLVFAAEQVVLSMTWSEIPKTGFLATRPVCVAAK